MARLAGRVASNAIGRMLPVGYWLLEQLFDLGICNKAKKNAMKAYAICHHCVQVECESTRRAYVFVQFAVVQSEIGLIAGAQLQSAARPVCQEPSLRTGCLPAMRREASAPSTPPAYCSGSSVTAVPLAVTMSMLLVSPSTS